MKCVDSARENAALFDSGRHALSSKAAVGFQPTEMSVKWNAVSGLSLYPNHLNPSNPSMITQFALGLTANAIIEIYNIVGKGFTVIPASP